MIVLKLAVPALAATALLAQVRFDHRVRNDLFAGFAGNAEALKRGMETCEKTLAENPNHPEALVWHGAATFFLSAAEFQKGNQQKGIELSTKGVAEMDRAVTLAPDNIAVRIPRGASMMSAARQMPDNPFRQDLLEKSRSDYQRIFDMQKGTSLDRIGTHPLGELLQGLGDTYSRQGKPGEAQKYYAMIQEKLPGTEYARRATQWMGTKQPLPPAQGACVGCHTSAATK